MFNKLCFSLLLIICRSCFGQVTVIGGTATNVGPSAAIAPLISTPEIALPGNGSAVGAPLASAATNDSRYSPGPMVYNPNGAEYVVPGSSVSGVGALPGGESKDAAAAEPFEFGIQHFQSAPIRFGTPPVSLGEIARNYRSQPHQAARVYTNDSIAQMNAGAVTTGNLGIESTAQISTASIATVVSENYAPTLPQSDREITAQARSTGRLSPGRGQLRDWTRDQDATDPATTTAKSAPATTTSQTSPASSQPSKLPQTGSYFFVLSLVGGAVLVGGVLYWMQR